MGCRGLVCVCAVGKMAKDIGMTICKSIVVSFLPCLVAFLAFHPYMFFHFFKCFFVTCFCCIFGGEKTMDHCGGTAAACNYIHKGNARQCGQRLQVVGIYSTESEADTDSI